MWLTKVASNQRRNEEGLFGLMRRFLERKLLFAPTKTRGGATAKNKAEGQGSAEAANQLAEEVDSAQ